MGWEGRERRGMGKGGISPPVAPTVISKRRRLCCLLLRRLLLVNSSRWGTLFKNAQGCVVSNHIGMKFDNNLPQLNASIDGVGSLI